MAELIVPPELARLVSRMSKADLNRTVGQVVSASKPAAKRPPKFGSLTRTHVTTSATGFTAESSGPVVMGAQFGGRRAPRKPYVTRSRRGTAYVVRRRTTQQFLPFNPRGYALTPAMRQSMDGIRKRITDAVEQAVT